MCLMVHWVRQNSAALIFSPHPEHLFLFYVDLVNEDNLLWEV